MNGKAEFFFPSEARPDISAEIGRDLFPGSQQVVISGGLVLSGHERANGMILQMSA
jgi:hypothetical protein